MKDDVTFKSTASLGEHVTTLLSANQQDDLWFPHLGRYSICSLIPTAADLLGIKSPILDPYLEERSLFRGDLPKLYPAQMQLSKTYKNVLVLLIDSVSYDYFMRLMEHSSVLPTSAPLFPLSSIFPSMTQACLPSIWAAAPPSRHGIYGRLFYLPEIGDLAGPYVRSARSLTEGVADDEFVRALLRIPSLGSPLTASGVDVKVYVTSNYSRFSSIIYGDLEVNTPDPITAANFEQTALESRIQRMLAKDLSILKQDEVLMKEVFAEFERPTDKPRLIFTHLLGVGESIHVLDVEAEEGLEAMMGFWQRLKWHIERFYERNDTESVILISSDHGALTLDKNLMTRIENNFLKEVSAYSLALPAGNQRSAFVYPANEQARYQLQKRLEVWFKETIDVWQVDTALYKRLFGEPASEPLRRRAGEVLMMSKGHGMIQAAYDFKHKAVKVSDHGGLKRLEMLVPFALLRH